VHQRLAEQHAAAHHGGCHGERRDSYRDICCASTSSTAWSRYGDTNCDRNAAAANSDGNADSCSRHLDTGSSGAHEHAEAFKAAETNGDCNDCSGRQWWRRTAAAADRGTPAGTDPVDRVRR
jgi:hypothetical protein